MSDTGDDDDKEVWAHVTRGVTPLRHPDGKKTPPPPAPPRPVRKAPPPAAIVPAGNPVSTEPPGVDRRTDDRLRRGQMQIDARIDLHGMGQAEACAALREFLIGSYQQGRRCVLVITGKGRDGKGVLRDKTPQWLREGDLAGIVLRAYPAKPQHGGQGALYVLLRRRRD